MSKGLFSTGWYGTAAAAAATLMPLLPLMVVIIIILYIEGVCFRDHYVDYIISFW